MTNHQLLSVAMRQSAEDMGCAAEDFLKDENVIKASFEISPIPEGISADLPEQQDSRGLIGKIKKAVRKEKNKE